MQNIFLIYIGTDENDLQLYAQSLQFELLALDEAAAKEFSQDDVVVITSGTTPYHAAAEDAEIQKVIALLRKLLESDTQTLAIGVGMSALALAFDGEVEDHSERAEAGVVEIHRLAPAEGDTVFGDVPETFAAVAYRHDDIMQLPIEFVPLANSKMAQFHAIKLAGKSVYGLQFDPFLSLTNNQLSENEKTLFRILIQTLFARNTVY